MRDHERDFLIAEYEQAWAMILNIDERRFKFVEYYSAIFTAVVAVASILVSWRGTIDLAVAVPLTVLLGGGVMIGLTFRSMIKSERAANVRYREKINLIRGIFLDASEDPEIKLYLTRKDLGIKVGSDAQPSGIGSTLRGVMLFVSLEIAAMAAAIGAVWIAVLLIR